MKIPEKIRDQIKEKLWLKADEINWLSLTIKEKAIHYESWTKDNNVGGILGNYMDAREVRMYIKDMLMRPYSHAKFEDAQLPMKLLCIPSDWNVIEKYKSPFGIAFENGHAIYWGQVKDWRTVLMAAFERAFMDSKKSHGIVLLNVNGKYCDKIYQDMIKTASKKLGVSNIEFVIY